jgi:hypothetical protein
MKNLAIRFLLAFTFLAFAIPSNAGFYRSATNAVAVTSPARHTVTMPLRDGKPVASTNGWPSIVAALTGFAGLFVAGIPLGITAIVFGILGVTGPKKLKGLGIAGIILGILDIVGVIIYLTVVGV